MFCVWTLNHSTLTLVAALALCITIINHYFMSGTWRICLYFHSLAVVAIILVPTWNLQLSLSVKNHLLLTDSFISLTLISSCQSSALHFNSHLILLSVWVIFQVHTSLCLTESELSYHYIATKDLHSKITPRYEINRIMLETEWRINAHEISLFLYLKNTKLIYTNYQMLF